MKIAFGSVVYNKCLNYFDEFIKSLNGQSDLEFDLLLVNDNIDVSQENKVSTSFAGRTKMIRSQKTCTPYTLRVLLIEEAIRMGYDLLIFGDCDDTFSYNRIEKYKQHFSNEVTFFYNDIIIMNTSVALFKKIPKETSSINDILEKNYIGLSNSGINLRNISYKTIVSLKSYDTVAFDWIFYSVLLENGCNGILINDCHTNYRIHKENLAGIPHISRERIEAEIKTKICHYKALSLINPKYNYLYEHYKLLENQMNYSEESYIKTNDFWWGFTRYKGE